MFLKIDSRNMNYSKTVQLQKKIYEINYIYICFHYVRIECLNWKTFKNKSGSKQTNIEITKNKSMFKAKQ